MIILLGFIPSAIDCQSAYSEFITHYKKSFSLDRQQQFCINYLEYLKIKNECPTCKVTNIYDKDFNSFLRQTPPKDESMFSTETCQSVFCYSNDPLPTIQNLPESVDLREKGLITLAKDQQQCGSCWAFVVIGMLENSILRDHKKLRQRAFKKDAIRLDLSEQFLISNTYGVSDYCNGGDVVPALNYIVDTPKHWISVDITANFPYEYLKQWKAHYQNKFLHTRIRPSQYLLPYKVYNRTSLINVTGTAKTPVINLMKNDNEMDQDKVMQYLARGIAVAAAMYIQPGSFLQRVIMSYDGKIAIPGFACTGIPNHQVLIVGYGKFRGIDVWIVKNSIGPEWGNQGHIYMERGTNTMCLETYAFAIIPKHYNEKDGVFEGAYPTPYNLSRGLTGLDKDIIIKTIETDTSHQQLFVKISIVIIISLALISILTMKLASTRRYNHNYKKAENVVL
ncbi:Cathepsin L [Spironucleus salmonicida]|uniref:Cathepsin L n=1 Tax=Spironucleus salmonicida TaxID=348837 RepID=V6M619_9EUKA|nr:Cathepsin L [Spironucleus salmonicida]|eukprot:EST48814.1 Peptidase C1A subfamily [Spironucleus salmonicida]